MSSINLKKIFDINIINQIQNSFSKATGMAVYCTDLDGAVTEISSSSYVCDFLSDTSKTSVLDGAVRAKAVKACRPAVMKAMGGLVEFAVPIMFKGECLGAFVGGQVFSEEPDSSQLTKGAAEFGIPAVSYASEMKKVKVIPMAEIEANAEMLFVMLNAITNTAARGTAGVSTLAVAGSKGSLEAAKKLVADNEKTVQSLNKQIDSMNGISSFMVQKLDNAKDTVKSIQEIALNTRILGFNASIEASRSKESGKGFGVIAQEVRNLADVSKNSAELIETEIANINKSTTEIHEVIRDLNSVTYKIMDSFSEIKRLLEAMKEA
ncbi:MAG: PocR ligand-binding domain-containing protein [Oscillospiraceae bacterium]|jgi:ligand-binding sensor protein